MWLDGYSMNEIASELGTSKASVGTSIQQMRAKGIKLPYRNQPFSPAHPSSAVPDEPGHYWCSSCQEQKPHIAFPFPPRMRACFECISAKRKASTTRRRSVKPSAEHKEKARQILHHEVRVGRIVKPETCERCDRPGKPGPAGLHGHHADYSRPLDVEWLCPRCHSAEHRRLNFVTQNNGAGVSHHPAPQAKEIGSNACTDK
jgi:hypothetical protein